MYSTSIWETNLSPRSSLILTHSVPVLKDWKDAAPITVKELIPKAIEALKKDKQIEAGVGQIDGCVRWYCKQDACTYKISEAILHAIATAAKASGLTITRNIDTDTAPLIGEGGGPSKFYLYAKI